MCCNSVAVLQAYTHTNIHKYKHMHIRAYAHIHSGKCKLNVCALSQSRIPTHTQAHMHTDTNMQDGYNATHCNTLQLTATHCNTLQHTAIHCNTLQHTATLCNTLQHTATHCNTLEQTCKVDTSDHIYTYTPHAHRTRTCKHT